MIKRAALAGIAVVAVACGSSAGSRSDNIASSTSASCDGNAAGDVLWVQRVNGSGDDRVTAVAATPGVKAFAGTHRDGSSSWVRAERRGGTAGDKVWTFGPAEYKRVPAGGLKIAPSGDLLLSISAECSGASCRQSTEYGCRELSESGLWATAESILLRLGSSVYCSHLIDGVGDLGSDVAVDARGNDYVAWQNTDRSNWDPAFNGFFGDVWTLYAFAGPAPEHLWHNAYVPGLTSLATDSTGALIVAGDGSAATWTGGTSGEFFARAPGPFVAVRDLSDSRLWLQPLPARGIVASGSERGTVVVAGPAPARVPGISYPTADARGFLLAKDRDGYLLWSVDLAELRPVALAVSRDDRIVLVAHDPGSGQYGVRAFNSDGSVRWEWSLDPSTGEGALTSVAIDDDDTVLVGGWVRGHVNLGCVQSASGDEDGFVLGFRL